jgi:hypothetical protein
MLPRTLRGDAPMNDIPLGIAMVLALIAAVTSSPGARSLASFLLETQGTPEQAATGQWSGPGDQ